MAEQPKAVIFDLDDTLYRERRHFLSACAAVAVHVSARLRAGVPPRGGEASPGQAAAVAALESGGARDPVRQAAAEDLFRTLVRAARRGRRREALQQLCEVCGLGAEAIPSLVEVMRSHQPRLRLGARVRELLVTLRRGWRTGILTNGYPAVQARKVEALGLAPLVDEVVFAAAHGTGRGKPEAAPFREILRRLGVEPDRTVFVGDDPECDVAGARALGLATIRVARRSAPACPPDLEADRVVSSVSDVLWAAPALIERRVVHEPAHRPL